ncbi:hypothetical protein [uncultured Gilliamella sp.]|uniref:hypothetical protein n=1 Tax=uncultured Gilliamella sp. TaxID=1193505 RepID=UPI0025CED241|nr:hypothetical protein [uncultured Gilliamella sp.]
MEQQTESRSIAALNNAKRRNTSDLQIIRSLKVQTKIRKSHHPVIYQQWANAASLAPMISIDHSD